MMLPLTTPSLASPRGSRAWVLQDEDVYLAVPLQQGQISCREPMRGEVILKAVPKDQPITIDAIDSPYANIPPLKTFYSRGLNRNSARTIRSGCAERGRKKSNFDQLQS
jgi:hypothetical protein